MLSETTTRNLVDAFRRAANTTLVKDPNDTCSIVVTTSREPPANLAPQLLMITISSFVFRLVTIFQVSQEQPTRDYYTNGTQNTLDEVIGEIANMCCGALGRELSAHFKHLAMSIPYGLEAQCAMFLQELAPRFRESYDITINEAARLRITLCMCCNSPIELATPSAAAEVSHAGGELEMF